MRKDELELERKCREYARLQGWVAFKIENNGNKGVPDDGFLHPSGVFIMVEFKAARSARIRPEQKMWAERFPKTVFFCYDFPTFRLILDYALTHENPPILPK